MTNVLLTGILMMITIMNVGLFFWWKDYGIKIFDSIMGDQKESTPVDDSQKKFKIPNQWR